LATLLKCYTSIMPSYFGTYLHVFMRKK
jgi:hypothetical protein